MIVRIVFSLVFCFLPASLIFGQTARTATPSPATANETDRRTELDLFQERLGTVIVKGFTTIGKLSGLGGSIEVTAFEFTDASNRTKVLGLGIEVSDNERYATSRTSFIEVKEIDGLLRGLDYVAKADKSVTQLTNFEAKFKTKGNFSITTFNDSNGKLMVALSAGSVGAKSVFLPIDRLLEFRQLVANAKTTLDGLPK